MKREWCATVYVFHEKKVLLIYHRKLKKWLPPGGHVEENETPVECAVREALEETGYEVDLVPMEALWIDCWNAKTLLRPYLCLLEEIPPFGDEPAHQHMDFVYLGKLKDPAAARTSEPEEKMAWFSLEEIEAMKSDEAIFDETKQVLRHLMLSTPKPASSSAVPAGFGRQEDAAREVSSSLGKGDG